MFEVWAGGYVTANEQVAPTVFALLSRFDRYHVEEYDVCLIIGCSLIYDF